MKPRAKGEFIEKSSALRTYTVMQFLDQLQAKMIGYSASALEGNINSLLPLISLTNEFWSIVKKLISPDIQRKEGINKDIRRYHKRITDLIIEFNETTNHMQKKEIKKDLRDFTWTVITLREKVEGLAKLANLDILPTISHDVKQKLKELAGDSNWGDELLNS